MNGAEWRPFRGTVAFFARRDHHQRVASWRHFGLELEIEMRGWRPVSAVVWRANQ